MKKGDRVVKDITGTTSGYIRVISFSHIIKRRTHWNCVCRCGSHVTLSRKTIQESSELSCGCIPKAGKGPQGLRNFDDCVKHKMNCIMNASSWNEGCLIWSGALAPDGFPRCSFLNIAFYIKDFLWFSKTRQRLGNYKIAMSCNNKLCININHMELENGRRNKAIDRLFEVSENRRKQTDFKKSRAITG